MIHRLSMCLVVLMLGVSGQGYAEVILSGKYTMNIYKMTCKKWRNNQPMQLVIVTDMVADKHRFMVEADEEGGGQISTHLDALSQAAIPDETINRDVEILILRNVKNTYPSPDSALSDVCEDQKKVAKPSTPATKPAEPNDMSTVLCNANAPRIHAALGFRRGGMPISYAERSIDKLLTRPNQDTRLIQFLYSSVRVTYQDPNEMEAALKNGAWVKACAKHIRGY